MSDARRIVRDSMLGMTMTEIDSWSERVSVVLGLNPGPFTGPGTNTYLVGTGRKRILLDTGQGVPEYIAQLERGLTDTPGGDTLQEIVLTHGHPDHVGGIAGVLERFGVLEVSKKPNPGADGELEITPIEEGGRDPHRGCDADRAVDAGPRPRPSVFSPARGPRRVHRR